MLEEGGSSAWGFAPEYNIHDPSVFRGWEEAGRGEEEEMVGYILNFMCV